MRQIARHNTSPRWRRRAAWVVADRLMLVASATIVVVLGKALLLDIVVVQGRSMEPGLRPGDCVLVEKVTPRLGVFKAGQVVVAAAKTPGTVIVKRIVAMGGDEAEIHPDGLIVNGKAGPAEDETIPPDYRWGPEVVPQGQLLLLGDNRPRSHDGADFGPLPATNVKGHVIARLGHWRCGPSAPFRVLVRAASSESMVASSRSSATPPPAVARTVAAMADVETARVMVNGGQIWISEDHGVRWDTRRGFTIYTDEGTWEYDRKENTVVISRGMPCATWTHFQRLSGAHWLPPLGCGWWSYEYTVSDALLDGKPAKRIDTNSDAEGQGATFWVDSQSMRVVSLEKWRVHDGRRQRIGSMTRVEYDAPMDPDLFVPRIPEGALVVDHRAGAKRGASRPDATAAQTPEAR